MLKLEDHDQKALELIPRIIELAKSQKEKGETTILVSLIQRRLLVGHILAAKAVHEMEDMGYLGPYSGSKGRKILL